MNDDLRRDFADRADLSSYVRSRFPSASAETPSPIVGGRRAAEAVLNRVRPDDYGRTRNHLAGAVTRLSPYLRHGVVTLAQVRDHVLHTGGGRPAVDRLVTELAWRDYYRRVYAEIGDGVWNDRETSTTGFTPRDYTDSMPAEVAAGATDLACIDAFVAELHTTGYLHNHARMWTAAYLVHWRRIRWKVGARWFLTHLLDGDPSSNNLSW
ncbi:MAG: FAD-binding domain-containing protein, partial [Planctomycetia bacterium]